MDRIDEWLDDETVKALKSISKKFVSPENLPLTEEEALAVAKLKQHRSLPPHVIEHFLTKRFPP